FHHDSREHRCVGGDLNAYLVEGTSDIGKTGWETFIGASLVGEKQILSRERRHGPAVLAMVRIKPLTGDGNDRARRRPTRGGTRRWRRRRAQRIRGSGNSRLRRWSRRELVHSRGRRRRRSRSGRHEADPGGG